MRVIQSFVNISRRIRNDGIPDVFARLRMAAVFQLPGELMRFTTGMARNGSLVSPSNADCAHNEKLQ
jgi:hypothetical protein